MRVLCCLTAVLAVAAPALAGNIDPGLERTLQSAATGQTVSTLVFMKDQLNVAALDSYFESQAVARKDRALVIVPALQLQADLTQSALRAELEALQAAGRVEQFEAFWIDNSFRVDATADVIRQIAAREDVGTVYYNYEIELIKPIESAADPFADAGGPDAPEIGLVRINVPQVWAMGITGKGVLVSNMDTGVWLHIALSGRWAGTADPRYAGHPEWAWYDPRGVWPTPNATNSHGTHTMGTVCGGPPGDEIGAAPGAFWMASAPIDRVSIPTTVADAKLSFQWMLNPDKNANTTWDIPDTNSNSWRLVTGHGYPPCDQTFWTYIDNCEAAGTIVLFSAGNEGPGANTLGRPPDRATDDYNVCAVGAVDGNNPSLPIASFSSRGPSYCTPSGQPFIKPNISAPGVNVRSSVIGGGYALYSGTSMASPHINGVCALMLEACPRLSVKQVKDFMYKTAMDKGGAGKDNDYGWGVVDALAAVLMAKANCGLKGDMNCDGVVNNFDIDPFVLALTDPAGYKAKYPNCDIMNGDCNGDGVVDNFDIDPFVKLLTP